MIVTIRKVTHYALGRVESWVSSLVPRLGSRCGILVWCSVNTHLQHDTFFALITDFLYPPSVGKLEHLGLPALNPQ